MIWLAGRDSFKNKMTNEGDEKMENIMVQDFRRLGNSIKSVFTWLVQGLPLLFRIVICLAISKITVMAFGIKEIIFWNGWINVTILTGMVICQIILALYIKAYQREQEDKLTKG